MPGVIVDIGTGDGSFVIEMAKKYPDRMIIGIEPNQSGLLDASSKTIKKPAKGGVKNALFVLANALDLPDDLRGVANQVFINFPWGSLLSGIILGDKVTWENITKICQREAFIDIIVGYDKSLEIKEVRALPDLNVEYFKNILSPQLKGFGFELKKVKHLNSKIIKNYPTTWAKKLSFANPRNFYYLQLQLKNR